MNRWRSSHAHRLLSVMVEEGLLRRGPYSPRYRLGLRLFELGRLAVADLDPPLAIPGMQELSQKTGETVLLALRDRADVVFLQRVDSPQVLRVSPPLHRRYPAWTAAGQSILAWETEAEIAYVARTLFTGLDDTQRRAEQFHADLEMTRQLGYSVNDPGRGIRAVAAPIRDARRNVVAAISLAAPNSTTEPRTGALDRGTPHAHGTRHFGPARHGVAAGLESTVRVCGSPIVGRAG